MPNRQPNFVSSRHYVELAEQFIDIGFWNADIRGGEIRGTDGFSRLTGLPRGEAINFQRWISLLHPDDRENFRALFSIATMGESVSREVRLVQRNHPPRWVRIAAEHSAVNGRLVGLIQGLSSDREARAAVYRERARLTTFLDMTREIFWSMDLAGTIIDRRGWQAITGQDPDEAENVGWETVIHPDDRDRVLEKWSICLREEVAFESYHRLRYADGMYKRVLARCMPVRQENGAIIEWLGGIQEIWRVECAEPRLDHIAALKPQQLRAARAMLGWSADRLAHEAGVSPATIRRYETTDEHMKEVTVSAILAVLNRHGIVMSYSSGSIGVTLAIENEPQA